MSKRLPGSQIRCVITRAPRELRFCVLVGSVIDGWSKLDNCTGSIAEIRASDRESGQRAFASMMWGLTTLCHPLSSMEGFAHWNAVIDPRG
jgi:hypothetical protein